MDYLSNLFGSHDESPPLWTVVVVLLGLVVGGIVTIVHPESLSFREYWAVVLVAAGLLAGAKAVNNHGKNTRDGRIEAAAILARQAEYTPDPEQNPPKAESPSASAPVKVSEPKPRKPTTRKK